MITYLRIVSINIICFVTYERTKTANLTFIGSKLVRIVLLFDSLRGKTRLSIYTDFSRGPKVLDFWKLLGLGPVGVENLMVEAELATLGVIERFKVEK